MTLPPSRASPPPTSRRTLPVRAPLPLSARRCDPPLHLTRPLTPPPPPYPGWRAQPG
jgi:hypothetical protein